MRETEITIQVFEELESILTKLKRLGFNEITKFELNDWYFNSSNVTEKAEYSSLIKNSFLVRQVIENGEEVYLIYKDKEITESGEVLSEEKIKVKLSSLNDALKIFDKAGIECWCSLKQEIFVFKKDEIEFMVQSVRDLGNFIEYEEVASMSAMNHNEKIEYMHSQVKSLGLNLGDNLSCKKVYMKYMSKFSK